MKVKQFINDEFKQFSIYDTQRSIPSIIDGLKPSQRKVMYGIMKHGTKSIKVAQLGAYVAQVSHYAHGEKSLEDTIVGLAQDFTGSNNINLLEPDGQFGSILDPTSASSRYIYTNQSKYLRQIFRKEDELILNYLEEDGHQIEPQFYLPILPMSLVNGTVGIGTGFATKICGHNPKDLVRTIKRLVKNENAKVSLTPWYKGFKGTIEVEDGSVVCTGVFEKENTTTLKVTELPVGYTVDKYKKILVKLIEDGKIKDFDNNSTEQGFEFIINAPRETLRKSDEQLVSLFKLSNKLTQNFTLWDHTGAIKDYGSAEAILREFVILRLHAYEARRVALIEKLTKDVAWLKLKKKFILKRNQYDRAPKEDELKKDVPEATDKEFDRLMSLSVRSLTVEKIAALDDEIADVEAEITKLKTTTKEKMYLKELDELDLR